MTVTPTEYVKGAIDALCASVRLVEAPGASSHTAVVAAGLDDPGVAEAVGRYLLGVIAGAIQLDASLSAALLPDGPDGQAEVAAQVLKAVGADNSFVEKEEVYFRDRVRNAWIGEGLGHAMLIVRSRQESDCVIGRVEAISLPHAEPSESGLDAVAIYTVEGEPFVAIEETKATHKRPVDELRKAAGMFAAIDAAKYGSHLRNHLIALRGVLPAAVADQVTNSLWKDAACYLPVVVHGEAFEHGKDRSWLASLRPPADRRRLLVLRIEDFQGFFDRVSDTMRAEAHRVVL